MNDDPIDALLAAYVSGQNHSNEAAVAAAQALGRALADSLGRHIDEPGTKRLAAALTDAGDGHTAEITRHRFNVNALLRLARDAAIDADCIDSIPCHSDEHVRQFQRNIGNAIQVAKACAGFYRAASKPARFVGFLDEVNSLAGSDLKLLGPNASSTEDLRHAVVEWADGVKAQQYADDLTHDPTDVDRKPTRRPAPVSYAQREAGTGD